MAWLACSLDIVEQNRIGTALGGNAVWFSISRGILNGVEAAGGSAHDEAREALVYLEATQDGDGHRRENMATGAAG